MGITRILTKEDFNLIPTYLNIFQSNLKEISNFYDQGELEKTLSHHTKDIIKENLISQENKFYFGHFINGNLEGILIETDKITSSNGLIINQTVINWVMSNIKRKGVGSSLIKKSIEQARNKNKDVVSLGVSKFNKNAKRLYEKLGFELNTEYGNNMLMLCYYINQKIKPY